MKNIFNNIAINKPKRNQFDLSRERKQTQQMGDLVPCFLQEVMPNDTFKVNTEVLVRFAPMLAPLMHRIDVHIHYFYIPFRILWDEWEDFITGGEQGQDLPSFPRTSLNANTVPLMDSGSLADYLGIRPQTTNNNAVEFSLMPFRAFQLVYDEYYRDQNLTASLEISKGSGIVTDATELGKLFTLRKKAWEKDYFTSCLPWTQRGADVVIPLGNITGGAMIDTGVTTGLEMLDAEYNLKLRENSANSTDFHLEARLDDGTFTDISLDTDSTSVNALREALRIQRWLEISARAGSRYVEQIYAHYGVRVKDFRLQRPEFLGGGKTPVMISEVLNQYQDQSNANDTPVGEMFGHAISVGEQNGFKAFFPEHGLVLGILSIIPRSSYQDGLHRLWNKFDKFDYFFPEFAHLGEQDVKVKELYFTSNHTNNEETFGYQQRFAEYKYANSTTHGDFRDDFDYWHLTRKFATKPTLNTSFIECNPDQRIFAVTDTSVHKCWVSMYHKVSAQRPIPYFAIPSI